MSNLARISAKMRKMNFVFPLRDSSLVWPQYSLLFSLKMLKIHQKICIKLKNNLYVHRCRIPFLTPSQALHSLHVQWQLKWLSIAFSFILYRHPGLADVSVGWSRVKNGSAWFKNSIQRVKLPGKSLHKFSLFTFKIALRFPCCSKNVKTCSKLILLRLALKWI